MPHSAYLVSNLPRLASVAWTFDLDNQSHLVNHQPACMCVHGSQVFCFSTDTQLKGTQCHDSMSALCPSCSMEMPGTHLRQFTCETDIRAQILQQQGLGLGLTITQQVRHEKRLYSVNAEAPLLNWQ